MKMMLMLDCACIILTAVLLVMYMSPIVYGLKIIFKMLKNQQEVGSFSRLKVLILFCFWGGVTEQCK